jgi:hypothetical protein
VAIPIDREQASDLRRADLVVSGLEQAGASFELRAFVNNPKADAGTEPTPEAGYAGSIYIYGYGQPPESLDPESGTHPRLPMTRYVDATDAVRAAAAQGPAAAVTLVPVSFATPGPDIHLDDVDVSVLIHE